MRRRLLLLAAAMALLLGQPGSAMGMPWIGPGILKEIECEVLCADKANEYCRVIDSMKCNFYLAGCLSGCNYGKLIKQK